MGRVFSFSPTLTLTTPPSDPGNTLNTLPNGHFLRVVSGDITNTMLPYFKSLYSLLHFRLGDNEGSHLCIHRFQKCRTSS